MRTMVAAALCCLSCLAALAAPALADEVVFRNGDRLTGTIGTLTETKLTIKSTVAGDVTVELKNVRTFSSNGPIELVLKNGASIRQRVLAAGEGKIVLAPGGPVAPQEIALADIKKLNPEKAHWSGSLTAGGLLTRGNTNTDNFNLAFNATRRQDSDRITTEAQYLYGRQKISGEKKETANSWYIAGKYDHFLTPRFYGYANARVERDVIADLSLRFTPGVGAGYQWADKPEFSFNTEGGVSWIYRDFSHDGSTDNFALRLAYHLKKKFNDHVSVFHDFSYFPGLDRISDYYFITDAGVRATITKKMFTEFKVELNYDAVPAPGKGSTDLRYIVGVGWNF